MSPLIEPRSSAALSGFVPVSADAKTPTTIAIKTATVALSLNASGQVVELGDSCTVFDIDRLKASRIRSWILGLLLALLGILGLVGWIGSDISSPPSADDLVTNIITGIIMVGALTTGAVLFIMAALKATRTLQAR